MRSLSCKTLPYHMTPLQGHCFLYSSEHSAILATCFWIPKKEQVMEKKDGKEWEFFSGHPRMQHISLRLRNVNHIQDCVNSFLDMTHGVLWRSSLSEMTQVLAHELSSDHLAKPNSFPLNQSLKLLSTNNPPYQLHLQDGCVHLGDRQPVFCRLRMLA